VCVYQYINSRVVRAIAILSESESGEADFLRVCACAQSRHTAAGVMRYGIRHGHPLPCFSLGSFSFSFWLLVSGSSISGQATHHIPVERRGTVWLSAEPARARDPRSPWPSWSPATPLSCAVPRASAMTNGRQGHAHRTEQNCDDVRCDRWGGLCVSVCVHACAGVSFNLCSVLFTPA
jgi:hypothetical protein